MGYLSYPSAVEAERDLADLRVARAVISRAPLWCQQELVEVSVFDGVPVAARCSLGALGVATGAHDTNWCDTGDGYVFVEAHGTDDRAAVDRFNRLQVVLSTSGHFTSARCTGSYHDGQTCSAVYCFNDNHGHAEVLAAWDAVIADVAAEAGRLRALDMVAV
jgi:hypothetical protein